MKLVKKHINRLRQSLAWKMFPGARLDLFSQKGFRIPMRARGDFATYQEVMVQRVYNPYFEAMTDIRSWYDIGCNCGVFSLALAEHFQSTGNALLIDANKHCVRTAESITKLNHLNWTVAHGIIGKPGEQVTFYENAASIRSNIFTKPKKGKALTLNAIDVESLWTHSKIPHHDLIKIDIEGAEVHLFPAFTSFINKFRYGLVEWHAPHFSGEQMRSWLEEENHEILIVQGLEGGEAFDAKVGMVLWKNRS